MDTTITISSKTANNKSDYLHLTYNTSTVEDAMISVDSGGFGRVPVTWDKSGVPLNCQSKSSFSNNQNDWRKCTKSNVENEIMKDIKNIAMQNCTYPKSFTLENVKGKESDSKSLILVRCDFNKSTNVQQYYPTLNPFNRSTSLINYFKEESAAFPNLSSSASTNLKQDSMDVGGNEITEKQRPISKSDSSKPIVCPSQNHNYSTSRDTCLSSTHMLRDENSESNGDVPLSPESRKKELCKYLKLMNPADKKEILKLQNRRSTRVRNLTVIQEQKQILEKSLKQPSGKQDSNLDICSSSKLFKELNIRVEKYEVGEEQNDTEKSFCIPFPPKELIEAEMDFDIIMSTMVPKFKRICSKKNIKCEKEKIKESSGMKTNDIPEPQSQDYEIRLKYEPSTKKNPTNEKKVFVKNMTKKKIVTKKINIERINSLRSKGRLKSIPLKKNIRKRDEKIIKWKALKQKEMREQRQRNKEYYNTPSSSVKSRKNSDAKSTSSKCEIVSVDNSIESDIDLENFMDDMVDFDNLSEEHRKCLIKNRILSTKPMSKALSSEEGNSQSFCSLQSLSPLYGFSKPDGVDIRNIAKPHKNLTSESKTYVQKLSAEHETEKKDVCKKDSKSTKIMNENGETVPSPIIGGNTYLILNIHRPEVHDHKNPADKVPTENTCQLTGASLQEHDYAGSANEKTDNINTEVDVVTVPIKNVPLENYLEFNTKHIVKENKYALLPYNKSVEMKSLHRSLQFSKKKNNNITMDSSLSQEWDSDGSPKQKMRKSSHSISIDRENGPVLKAFYVDHNLIVCQEYLISFWMQTPLGNILGSQNMWVPRGQTQRIVLNNKCVQKESMERVISTETSVVYIELWMKEHKSEMRQGPVADVFITLYFWKQRQNGLDKKVLQLENINGFADDVQYSVMKSVPKIIVSWHCTDEDNVLKRTFIHAYLLAADYQTVSNIYDIEPVDHYVSSLHNIEGCDNLIMGCGENKITLWNIEFGYIVATVELTDIKSPLSTLWVKCDRGFLFALQQCVDRELRLIAINGINHSWKKLASYFPPEGFDRLRGVCVENGLLLSFYDQGILCWKAETGEPVEEVSLETDIIPSGKYIILVEENQILVKHVMTHLMSLSVEES